MLNLIVIQLSALFVCMAAERIWSARRYPPAPGWTRYWLALQAWAAAWMAGVVMVWARLGEPWQPLESLSFVMQLVIFYLVYSLGNYWIHRLKHAWPLLWRYFHYLHHAPSHMESRVAYWRHPVEIVFNTIYLLVLGKALLGLDITVILAGLVVEGVLEMLHHSNVKTPRLLRPLARIIQLPEMHLLHHERGLHRYNYSPLALWDVIFGTWKVPHSWQWQGSLGVGLWPDIRRLMLFRY